MVLFSQIRGAIGEIQRREWALLCLETLGVLAGIFIAFQLNEWAMSRRESGRNLELVERLFEEVQRNVSRLRDQRTLTDALVGREMKFATQLVHEKRCPSDPDLWKSVHTVSWYPPLLVETSVYDEMMGAGGLATIENTEVRRAVSRFQTHLQAVKDRTAQFRLLTNPALPVDHPNTNVSFDPKRDDPIDITFNRPALCEDDSFKKRVADTVRDHSFVMEDRAELVGTAIEMCSSLGFILDKKCTPVSGGPLTGRDAQTAQAAWKVAAAQ